MQARDEGCKLRVCTLARLNVEITWLTGMFSTPHTRRPADAVGSGTLDSGVSPRRRSEELQASNMAVMVAIGPGAPLRLRTSAAAGLTNLSCRLSVEFPLCVWRKRASLSCPWSSHGPLFGAQTGLLSCLSGSCGDS